MVAVDVETGKDVWHFQVTRHDVRDYDLGSQPTMFDFPGKDGKPPPVVLLPTKQGDIYILDLATGDASQHRVARDLVNEAKVKLGERGGHGGRTVAQTTTEKWLQIRPCSLACLARQSMLRFVSVITGLTLQSQAGDSTGLLL